MVFFHFCAPCDQNDSESVSCPCAIPETIRGAPAKTPAGKGAKQAKEQAKRTKQNTAADAQGVDYGVDPVNGTHVRDSTPPVIREGAFRRAAEVRAAAATPPICFAQQRGRSPTRAPVTEEAKANDGIQAHKLQGLDLFMVEEVLCPGPFPDLLCKRRA